MPFTFDYHVLLVTSTDMYKRVFYYQRKVPYDSKLFAVFNYV